MATAKLEYVPNDSPSCRPFVVHFTNGNLNHGLHKKLNKKIKFACYQWADHADERKKHRRTLVAETDEMEYTGQNFGEFSRSNTMCKYVLGVYNSNTEVMKMYDTEIITLQPKVLVDANLNNVEDSQESKPILSYTEKNDLLTEAFRSSKMKKSMVSRLRNKVDHTNLGEKVADVVQAISSEMLDKTDGAEKQYSYIPPFNPNAKSAAEVYKLDDIVTPSEFEVLQKESLEFQNSDRDAIKEWRTQKRFPEHILQHLEFMSVDKTLRLHQSCCLLYLSYMMTFYGLNNKALRKKDPLPGIPNIIQEKLFSVFSLKNGKTRAVTRRLRDKLVSYMLVLALIIDEYSLDCGVIIKDLGLAPSRLKTHLKAIGCVVRSRQQTKRKADDEQDSPKQSLIADLQIPLPVSFAVNLSQ